MGPFDHGIAERHGKALVEIGLGFGPFAGVDAAVPDLPVAGKLGGGQQLALAHACAFVRAAALVQVGGVVPLAHAFRAQAQRNRVGTAVQAGVEARGFFSSVLSGAGLAGTVIFWPSSSSASCS